MFSPDILSIIVNNSDNKELFNTIFLPEVLPNKKIDINFNPQLLFKKFNILCYFEEKLNLAIKIEENIYSFYRIYLNNEEIVNNTTLSIQYPTYCIFGKENELFKKALEKDNNYCCQISFKANSYFNEIREIPNTEKAIQFLLHFIDDKKSVEYNIFTKKHKNRVLWNKSEIPWRRDFNWIAFKIILKSLNNKDEYQKIISYIMYKNLDNIIENLTQNELKSAEIKIKSKIKKYNYVKDILEPILNRIKEYPYIIINNPICEKKYKLEDSKFYVSYNIDQKIEKKEYNIRNPTLYGFYNDEKFDYYFNHEQISKSKKILYCAMCLINEHKKLIQIYPELNECNFNFNKNIFDHLLLHYNEDIKLCEKVRNYFNEYNNKQIKDIIQNDELSEILGKRLFKYEIEEYTKNENILIDNYKKKINEQIKEIKYLEEELYSMRCYCNYEICNYCKKKKELNNKKEIIIFERSLPKNINKRYALYFELNYPEDLKSFRNNYFNFLSLFYEKNNIIEYVYYKQYTKIINNNKDIYIKSNELCNLYSTLKPVIVSHYKIIKYTLTLNLDDLILDFGMNINYMYDSSIIDYDKFIIPSLKLNDEYTNLYKFLNIREDDNALYTNQKEGKLNSNEEYIKFGSLLVGSNLRYLNLINSLSEEILDFDNENINILVITLLWLSDKNNKIYENEAIKLFDMVKYQINKIKDNKYKIIRLKIMIHILNRILTEKILEEEIKNYMIVIRKICDNFKCYHIKLLTYMYEDNFYEIMKITNLLREKNNNITFYSEEENNIYYDIINKYRYYNYEKATSFLQYNNFNVSSINWKDNGADIYLIENGNLYEINRQTGELLINTKPISILPDYILNNDDYKRLYGEKSLKSSYYNNRFYCKDVEIYKSINNNFIFDYGEYIYYPPELFTNLSEDLLSKYHFFRKKDGIIEFRNDINSSMIYRMENGVIYDNNNRKYYDINKQKFKDIFLNLTKNVNIWNNSIELYNVNLKFELKNNNIYYNNFRIKDNLIIPRVKNSILLENNTIFVIWDDKLHIFNYDEKIDYIKANNTIYSWLYLAYTYGYYHYHKEAWDILTTQCEPTEIKYDNINNILSLIEELSPKREYYPKHLKCMEKIEYNSLFDGYKLWVYQFRNFKIINNPEDNLRLYLIAFINNQQIYPFTKNFKYILQPHINTNKNNINFTEYSNIFNSIDISDIFFQYIFNGYDKIDFYYTIYKNNWNNTIVSQMIRLPNNKIENKYSYNIYNIKNIEDNCSCIKYRWTTKYCNGRYCKKVLEAYKLKEIINLLSINHTLEIPNNILYEPIFEKIKEIDYEKNTKIENIREKITWETLEQITSLNIRPIQKKIADHMLNDNITTQLNMGQGKTTMIIPMMIINILNKKRIPMIIYKRSLYDMHSNELKHKLGLLNIQIYHLQFNRQTNINNEILNYIKLQKNIVIVITPEELQSFYLKVKEEPNKEMEDFINNTFRIIDESDDILHPRNQLVYPYGNNIEIEEYKLRYNIPYILLNYIFDKYNDYILYENNLDKNEILKYVVSKYNNENTKNDYFENIMIGYLDKELLFNCLSLRYRVDYGVDFRRKSRLAVPFRAKDVPSERSEYSNIDKTILLTYIYWIKEGLKLEDLKFLLKIPKNIYNSFNINYPYESLNIYTILENYEKFKFNKKIIKYWLQNFIFPKFINQFEKKRSASGYHIINNNTCGFSGTNGFNILQPHTIKQKDLDDVVDTNNKLDILIQKQEYKGCFNYKINTDVLLDVGSLIIEDNYIFAKKWLEERKDKEAVIYFDKDKRYVYNGKINEEFDISIYKEKIEKTIVYIDQSHTIGTHFDFPDNFIATVTIGKNVSRDKLAQGCMRMRQLESTHKILFVSDKKIHDKIEKSCKGILDFVYENTKNDIQKWKATSYYHKNNYDNNSPLIDEKITLYDLYNNETDTNEEQEKEFEKEIEQQIQIERPPYKNPRIPKINDYINKWKNNENVNYNFKFDIIYKSDEWETPEDKSEENYYERYPQYFIQENNKIIAITLFEANELYRKTNKLFMISTIYHKNQKNFNSLNTNEINLFCCHLYLNNKINKDDYLKLIQKNNIENIKNKRRLLKFYKESDLENLLKN